MAAINTAILRALLASAKGAQGTRIQVGDSLEEIADLLDSLDAGTLELILQSLAVDDAAYGAGWNGSLLVPTRNAVYDEMQKRAIVTRHGDSYSGGVFSTASTSTVAITTSEASVTVATGDILFVSINLTYSHSALGVGIFFRSRTDSTFGLFENTVTSYRANTGGSDGAITLSFTSTPAAGTYAIGAGVRTSSGTVYCQVKQIAILKISTQ
jgi:hypothetical protein